MAKDMQAATASPAPGAPELAVLVVDDLAVVARQIADGLEAYGFRTMTAHSADDALQLLDRHEEIVAIVTDIRMPGRSGLDLAQDVLRARGNGNAVEVILVSGHARLDEASEWLRKEVSAYLSKPLRLADLAACVTQAAGVARARRGILPRRDAC